ncbi:hypothetical protein SAMN04490240_2777 [Rhodococcus pyridinivorans]|nr:hypothetical protein SAMN04490240_2777 [Rhodococcus pyridinivorans]
MNAPSDQSSGEGKSFWKSAEGIGALAALITALGAVLGVIVSTQGQEPPPPPPNDTSSPSSEPATATIALVYEDQDYGCTADITVHIANQVIIPTGARHTIRNVPIGLQPYSMTGLLQCNSLGVRCNLRESGAIDVAEGSQYAFVWEINTDAQTCSATLDEE